MKTVRVSYTILYTFEAPDNMDEIAIGFRCQDFAENNGFKSICTEWEAEIEHNGKIIGGTCMAIMEE